MKNKYNSSQKLKTIFTALFVTFLGFFATEAKAQTALTANDTFTWTGTTSSSWTDATNWTILRGTTTAGTNTYPGEVGTIDVVYINKSDTPFPAILDGQVIDIARLFVNNNFGSIGGATFTINAGAVLNVGNVTTASNNVVLNGGNIVNNGTLNIKALGTGFNSGTPPVAFPSLGINCSNPINLPTVPTEYSYSGSGTLTIDIPSGNFAGNAGIAVLGNSGTVTTPTDNANVTYRLVLNNPEITLNQGTTLGIGALRSAGGNNANKMIIAGTGLSLGSEATPSIGGLCSLGAGSNVVVEATVTLTLYSAATNANAGIGGFAGSVVPCNFTNRGTINILGSSSRSGINFSTGGGNTTAVPPTLSPPATINFNNEGMINVNLNALNAATGAFAISNGGGGNANAGTLVSLNNSGTMLLKNTANTIGRGFPISTFTGGEAAPLAINNTGTMTLDGTTYAFCSKTTLNNSNILNTNSELRSFIAVNNNLGGTINFVSNAATATTRQVNFTLTTASDVSGGVGSVYRDSNNNDFSVVVQKFNGGTSLVTNVLSSATVVTSGTLTRQTGAGTATIAYTAAGIAPLNNAVVGNLRNSGTINTGTATNLNNIAAPSTITATSVLSPGGDTGKGILTMPEFPAALADLLTLDGTLKIQASGSTTAGVDYDMMQIRGAADVINIAAATLDLTGLYTPAAITTIDILTTFLDPDPDPITNKSGAVVGEFAAVVGKPAGWSVVYNPGLGSKVQLFFDPATLGTNTFSNFKFSVYPNPTSDQLNLSAAKTISKVELFNLLGQKVQSNVVNANQKQLSIAALQNGIYLMEVTIENAKQTFKIVKQ